MLPTWECPKKRITNTMARDTFVRFKKSKRAQPSRPSKKHLRFALEDYVRDIATEVKWSKGRFIVLLPGTCCNPITRLMPRATNIKAQKEDPLERWFEVWLGYDHIDVITRFQDEVTNNIATGFAEFCARFWEGELEL